MQMETKFVLTAAMQKCYAFNEQWVGEFQISQQTSAEEKANCHWRVHLHQKLLIPSQQTATALVFTPILLREYKDSFLEFLNFRICIFGKYDF